MKVPTPGRTTEGSVMTAIEPSRKLIRNVTAAARGMLPLP